MSEAAQVGAPGVVENDVACRKCAYNLRGLSVWGICPECGERVEASLTQNRLRSAPTKWLRAVRSGGYIIVFSLGVGVVSAVSLVTLAQFATYYDQIVLATAGLVFTALLVGVFRVTRRPVDVQARKLVWFRWLARAAVVAPFGLVAEAALERTLGPPFELLYLSLPLLMAWGLGCYFKYLAELIRYVPDFQRAQHVSAAGVATFITAGFLSLGALLVIIFEFTATGSWEFYYGLMMLFGCVTTILGLVTFVFACIAIVEQIRLSRLIGRQLRARGEL